MKPGLVVGTEASVVDQVTPAMRPSFGGQVIHPVYGTAAMISHMEWAARRVILPYLQDDEDGVGSAVCIRHVSPAPVGAKILARAICTQVEGNRILCTVEVWTGGRLLGKGEVEQYILPRGPLYQKFHALLAEVDASQEDIHLERDGIHGKDDCNF